jgi:hypothetical protein
LIRTSFSMEDFDIVFFKDLALGGKPMSFVELLFFLCTCEFNTTFSHLL